MRINARATSFATLFVILAAFGIAGTAVAGDGGNKGRLQAKAEIEDLMTCYAYTFDAIARAVDAIPQPLDSELNAGLDPNFAEGLERFRGCTTADWTIAIQFPNGFLLENFIPPGPLAWVNLVNNLARDPGDPGPSDDEPAQINSQHLFGSFSTTVKGRMGTVQAYAFITTYFEDATSSTGTSTYVSDVVFERGEWLLKKTTLIIN